MKKIKFIIKVAAALLPLWVIWAYTALFPVNYQNTTYTLFKWNKDFISTGQEKRYDVVFLGDSLINAAVLLEILSEETVNLAKSMCSPVEAYYTLEEYLAHNQPPKVCYVGFSNNIMNVKSTTDAYFLMHQLGFKEAIDVAWNAWDLMAHNQEAKRSESFVSYYDSIDLLGWVKKLCYFPSEYMTYLINSRFNGRKADNLYWIDYTKRHRGVWTVRSASVDHSHDGEQEKLEEYKVQPMMDRYFSKIVELCKEHGIVLRVVDPPYPDYVEYTDDYKTQYLDYYQAYADGYEKMTIAGIFKNLPSSCYGDGYHLNLHGAYEASSLLRGMYSEDFSLKDGGEGISEETVQGIAEYLSLENSSNYLLKWTEGKKFSIAVLFYERPRESELLEKLKKEYGYRLGMNCIYVKGTSKNVHRIETVSSFSVDASYIGTNIENIERTAFRLPWGGEYIVERKYDRGHIPDMQMVILNGYDNSVVGVKSFIYNHRDYHLIS